MHTMFEKKNKDYQKMIFSYCREQESTVYKYLNQKNIVMGIINHNMKIRYNENPAECLFKINFPGLHIESNLFNEVREELKDKGFEIKMLENKLVIDGSELLDIFIKSYKSEDHNLLKPNTP